MKYNCNLDAVIYNYRRLAAVRNIPTDTLTNKQMWELIDKSQGMDSEDADEYVLDLLREKLTDSPA